MAIQSDNIFHILKSIGHPCSYVHEVIDNSDTFKCKYCRKEYVFSVKDRLNTVDSTDEKCPRLDEITGAFLHEQNKSSGPAHITVKPNTWSCSNGDRLFVLLAICKVCE